MRVKFAYTASGAAKLATSTVGSKGSDRGARSGAAASVAVVSGGETIVRIGHAAPFADGIAHLGKDNENGARLAIEEISTQGLAVIGRCIDPQFGGKNDAAARIAARSASDHPAQQCARPDVVGPVGRLILDVLIPVSTMHRETSARRAVWPVTAAQARQRVRTTKCASGQASVQATRRAHRRPRKAAHGTDAAAPFAASDAATDIRAIPRQIQRVQPDGIRSGGLDATGSQSAAQTAMSVRWARNLGDDGVYTVKVGEQAAYAMHNPVCPEASLALSATDTEAAFDRQHEDCFYTPVRSYAPLTHDAHGSYASVDAMKRANSIEAPKVLAAMPAAGYTGVTGHIAFVDKGDLREGAITLHDFRDSHRAVLDVVKMW